eukprot:6212634-Pleurochrysis_carterae.AAC.2
MAVLLPDDYEAMALDKIHKYVALQQKIQDLTPDEMFDEACDKKKMHDCITNRFCAVGDGWHAYCDTMKRKYDAFIFAACNLVQQARDSTAMRPSPSKCSTTDYENFYNLIKMAYYIRIHANPHYKMAALRIVGYMTIFHEFDSRHRNARHMYIHGRRMMKNFLAVFALEAG